MEELKIVFAVLYLILVLSPLILLIVLYLLWLKTGKDPKGKDVIVPQYAPEEKYSPALAGLVMDEKVKQDHILATFIDLEQRGFIKIDYHKGKFLEYVNRQKNSTTYSSYIIYIEKQEGKDFSKLRAYEQTLLAELFKDKEKKIAYSLSSDRLVNKVKYLICQEAADLRLFEKSPQLVRDRYFKIYSVLRIIGLWTFILGVGIFIFADAHIFLFFKNKMIKKTKEGVRFKEWNQGLMEYIHHAERYRIDRPAASPHQLLAYAVAFDQFDHWHKHYLEEDDFLLSKEGITK